MTCISRYIPRNGAVLALSKLLPTVIFGNHLYFIAGGLRAVTYKRLERTVQASCSPWVMGLPVIRKYLVTYRRARGSNEMHIGGAQGLDIMSQLDRRSIRARTN